MELMLYIKATFFVSKEQFFSGIIANFSVSM